MDSSTIVDIVAGYYLSRDDNQPILSLEPSWYYLVNGSWIRLAPDLLGGAIMDWNKTKTIFIIVFSILNVFLIFFIFE